MSISTPRQRPDCDRWTLRTYVVIAGLLGLATGLTASTAWSRSRMLEAFHRYYYERTNTWSEHTSWLGATVEKLPMDLWTYQELLAETKPDVLLEMGTFKGGSAYYFASLFDLIGRGRVITVDIAAQPSLPIHPRITYLRGYSTSDEIVSKIKTLIKPSEKVMVVLDSDHHKQNVLNELRIYSKMVTPGAYLVVEDTNINGHPVEANFGAGPAEALTDFLNENHDFDHDLSREKFGITFNPGGWLRRKSS